MLIFNPEEPNWKLNGLTEFQKVANINILLICFRVRACEDEVKMAYKVVVVERGHRELVQELEHFDRQVRELDCQKTHVGPSIAAGYRVPGMRGC
jgi:hypothetical protein